MAYNGHFLEWCHSVIVVLWLLIQLAVRLVVACSLLCMQQDKVSEVRLVMRLRRPKWPAICWFILLWTYSILLCWTMWSSITLVVITDLYCVLLESHNGCAVCWEILIRQCLLVIGAERYRLQHLVNQCLSACTLCSENSLEPYSMNKVAPFWEVLVTALGSAHFQPTPVKRLYICVSCWHHLLSTVCTK